MRQNNTTPSETSSLLITSPLLINDTEPQAAEFSSSSVTIDIESASHANAPSEQAKTNTAEYLGAMLGLMVALPIRGMFLVFAALAVTGGVADWALWALGMAITPALTNIINTVALITLLLASTAEISHWAITPKEKLAETGFFGAFARGASLATAPNVAKALVSDAVTAIKEGCCGAKPEANYGSLLTV